MEETRSTLQFASRAKLVTTNATVNEVLDESAKLKRLKKELYELKEKQRLGGSGLSAEEQSRMELEKQELQLKLSTLQEEKDRQMVRHHFIFLYFVFLFLRY